jgi:hypothetical protein
MKYDYFHLLANLDRFLNDFKDSTLNTFFESANGNRPDQPSTDLMCFTPIYCQYLYPLKIAIELINLLQIGIFKEFLLDRQYRLSEPVCMSTREAFEATINDLLRISSDCKKEITEILSLLSKLEKDRLNEAVHCITENCYFSTVAMAVCAIESRLLNLMKGTAPAKKDELDKLTLGSLIKEYLENKTTYKNIIPKKHEPLLNLCNEYRVFSVHPKEEPVSKNVAQAVLLLAFEFLLDKNIALTFEQKD